MFWSRDNSIYKEINHLKKMVRNLEEKVLELQAQADQSRAAERAQLLRIKNGEELSNDFILNNHAYLDLSPEKAFRLYSDQDKDFVLLDVSRAVSQPLHELPEVRKIPLEDLQMRVHEIHGKGKSIFVISEDGVRSILACKVLSKLGFVNLNNVSGGYKFWPGFRKKEVLREIKSA